MATEIRMTQREKALTQASEAGRKSFQYNWQMGTMFVGDAALTEAWNQGYRLAKEESMQDYRYSWR